MIFFKVFLHSEGKGVKYLSGKRIIKPATDVSKILNMDIIKPHIGQRLVLRTRFAFVHPAIQPSIRPSAVLPSVYPDFLSRPYLVQG